MPSGFAHWTALQARPPGILKMTRGIRSLPAFTSISSPIIRGISHAAHSPLSDSAFKFLLDSNPAIIRIRLIHETPDLQQKHLDDVHGDVHAHGRGCFFGLVI